MDKKSLPGDGSRDPDPAWRLAVRANRAWQQLFPGDGAPLPRLFPFSPLRPTPPRPRVILGGSLTPWTLVASGLQCGGLKSVIWFLAGAENLTLQERHLGCKFIRSTRRDFWRWGAGLKSLGAVPDPCGSSLLSFPFHALSRSQPLFPNLAPFPLLFLGLCSSPLLPPLPGPPSRAASASAPSRARSSVSPEICICFLLFLCPLNLRNEGPVVQLVEDPVPSPWAGKAARSTQEAGRPPSCSHCRLLASSQTRLPLASALEPNSPKAKGSEGSTRPQLGTTRFCQNSSLEPPHIPKPSPRQRAQTHRASADQRDGCRPGLQSHSCGAASP